MIRRAADVYGYDAMEDRFCGGLSVSLACWRMGLKVNAIEDGNEALINCYRAVAEGWQPPRKLTAEDHKAIKERNDPADPMTAFALGFCSYGGIWGAGRMPDDERREVGTTAREACLFAAQEIDKVRPMLRELDIIIGDCTSRPVVRAVGYFDPPYIGTLGYAGAPPFDFDAAWRRFVAIADDGPTLVSEGRDVELPPWYLIAWHLPRFRGRLPAWRPSSNSTPAEAARVAATRRAPMLLSSG